MPAGIQPNGRLIEVTWFDTAFEALTGHAPFPWQHRLFARHFAHGRLPSAVDIPTGLGKTSVMAIWLLARAAGAALPRRLVYVVDRHAVVDQATASATQLRDALEGEALERVRGALGLGGRSLPISTLRGQHVDNREWMADPVAPAIVVGTVDMVGSRLLFQGYGLSGRMRPYAAGLLGCDTLVILDEAHLAYPFERLLRAIDRGQRASTAAGAGIFAGQTLLGAGPPPFRVLPLSATPGRDSGRRPFGLDGDDRANTIVRARLEAHKRLMVETLAPVSDLADALGERAWSLMETASPGAGNPPSVAVYCDRRADAETVAANLRKHADRDGRERHVILFVGGRRVHERQAANAELHAHGLLGDGRAKRAAPVFLVATSAGEVGVDLDADHMVCDVVAWERMVQRLGRVNRSGMGAARVLVIDQGPREKADEHAAARHQAVRDLLDALPPDDAGGRHASPGTLADLAAAQDRRPCIAAATTRPPLYPALTRPLVDAWAMTSLREHAGRPAVAPWLRGWVEDDKPQTAVVWRRYLPVRFSLPNGDVTSARQSQVRAFFAAAPPHTSELLETETWRVAEWLRKRVRKYWAGTKRETSRAAGDGEAAGGEGMPLAPLTWRAPMAFLLDSANRQVGALTLADIAGSTFRDLLSSLAGKRLVLDARLGGLKAGLLDDSAGEPPPTIEDNWGSDEGGSDGRQGNLRVGSLSEPDRVSRLHLRETLAAGPGRACWQDVLVVPYGVTPEGAATSWLIVQKRSGEGAGEDARAVAVAAQRLDVHQQWAGEAATRIADGLGLGEADRTMLVAAARHHDDGKAAPRWQRAFSAPSDWCDVGPYAKTAGPVNHLRLNGFRHEFKSVLDAEKNGLEGLDRRDPRFELALHLIAAHHGSARPGIGIDGCDELPPSVAEAGAHAVAVRFARLQRQWGPWGLAWWEALLRAADQAASRRLEALADQEQRRRAAAGAGEAG